MTRRPYRLVAAVAAGVLLTTLSACSGGEYRPPSTRADGAAPTTTAPPAPMPPTTAPPPETSLPPATSVSCPTIPDRAAPPADRPRYVLAVDVRPAEGTVNGQMTVAFTPDLPTAELVLRLWPNGPRPALGGARLDTGPVTVDGAPAPATRPDPTTLVVDPGRTIAAGTTVTIALTFTLRVPGPANDRIAHDADSLRLGSFFPILPWEPGVGWAREAAVGDFAEASTAPTADFDVTVTVPAGYDVLGSGEPTPAGSNHFVAPARRDVAYSIGHFDDIATAVAHAPDPVQMTVGLHTGVPGDAQDYLDQELAVLETFAARYGPYPWTTFTMAVTPGLGGGIEYPSHVMQGPFTEGDVTTHEVGHMWFYGLVGNDQGRDPWLDEGITSWAEAEYQQTLDEFAAAPIPRLAQGQLGQPMSFWTLRPSSYQAGVYVQGARALAALGPAELVDCALRVYVAQNAYGVATSADFVAAAQSVFPDAATTLAGFGISP